MSTGFIFNHNRCVNCSSCSAACKLENGWTIQPRMVYTYNVGALPSLPLSNLSLACNHCETPVCLKGCPAAAFKKEPVTGAVIIDDRMCIGCKYCQWNCPYDVPKFDSRKRIIGKCNLCYSGLTEGRLPACTTACPTGALNFGDSPDESIENFFPWFPDKKLNPAISFTGTKNSIPLRIIPERSFEQAIQMSEEKKRSLTSEWSLIAFSFLTTISVASIIFSLINGVFPDKSLFLLIIILAGLLSLFHLGKPLRAWRSVTNLFTSPLSLEITLFIIYSAVSFLALFFKLPGFLLASSFIGIALLIAIDKVYLYTDKRITQVIHSGQTFLSGLLIVSFFTGFVLPFLFIAMIKLLSSVYCLYVNKINGIQFGVRFIRIALLIVTGVSMVSGISYPDPVISFISLSGELIDRVIFYIDFNPVNIKSEIIMHINTERDEKKRG